MKRVLKPWYGVALALIMFASMAFTDTPSRSDSTQLSLTSIQAVTVQNTVTGLRDYANMTPSKKTYQKGEVISLAIEMQVKNIGKGYGQLLNSIADREIELYVGSDTIDLSYAKSAQPVICANLYDDFSSSVGIPGYSSAGSFSTLDISGISSYNSANNTFSFGLIGQEKNAASFFDTASFAPAIVNGRVRIAALKAKDGVETINIGGRTTAVNISAPDALEYTAILTGVVKQGGAGKMYAKLQTAGAEKFQPNGSGQDVMTIKNKYIVVRTYVPASRTTSANDIVNVNINGIRVAQVNPQGEDEKIGPQATETPDAYVTNPPYITSAPTTLPTTLPTTVPTTGPTTYPTTYPTTVPTSHPTTGPTTYPTTVPTDLPTLLPTTTQGLDDEGRSTLLPTTTPTTIPTTVPTTVPTEGPISVPTTVPTNLPTNVPTTGPTSRPTSYPTTVPTSYPTTAAWATPTPKPSPTATTKPNVNWAGGVSKTNGKLTTAYVHYASDGKTPIGENGIVIYTICDIQGNPIVSLISEYTFYDNDAGKSIALFAPSTNNSTEAKRLYNGGTRFYYADNNKEYPKGSDVANALSYFGFRTGFASTYKVMGRDFEAMGAEATYQQQIYGSYNGGKIPATPTPSNDGHANENPSRSDVDLSKPDDEFIDDEELHVEDDPNPDDNGNSDGGLTVIETNDGPLIVPRTGDEIGNAATAIASMAIAAVAGIAAIFRRLRGQS